MSTTFESDRVGGDVPLKHAAWTPFSAPNRTSLNRVGNPLPKYNYEAAEMLESTTATIEKQVALRSNRVGRDALLKHAARTLFGARQIRLSKSACSA